MYICRLFQRDRPYEEVEARLLADGQITIGRDPAADWPLPDPDGTLSRIHCTLGVEDGRLILSDRSTNGTFLDDGTRVARTEPVAIDASDRIHLGGLSILVDRLADADAAIDATATRLHIPLSPDAAPLPTGWADDDDAPDPEPEPAHRDASLLQAFCDGAHLDASVLSSEDPVELMRRAGAIYQQTILGLATLMAERTRLKGEYELDRTTVGAMDNNPFKWAPTRRLAQDLLCTRDTGFLSDADAVRASFEDLGIHLAATAEGARAALDAALATLSPAAIDAEARTQGLSLRGRAATCWDIHTQRHATLAAAPGGRETPIARAFGDAYARAGRVLVKD